MRWFLLVLNIVGFYLFDQAIMQTAENLAFRATASMGFIILTGYLAGKIVKDWGLPNLTGYLFSGILCGPYLLDLVHLDIHHNLQIVDELALCFIAFTAGGELDYRRLKERAFELGSMIGFSLPTVFVSTTAVMYVLMRLTNLPTPGAGWIETFAAAVVFGAMATGMSPTTTMAIIMESKAKGILAETVMAITVAADVVIIILFTVTLSLVKGIFEPGETETLTHVFFEVGWEIGGSLVAGVLLGMMMILYLRVLGGSVFLFLLGLSLALIEFAQIAHVSLLLMCMVSGFVVNNFSHLGHNLITGIERGSVAVFIIFFTLAGAGLDYRVLGNVWHLALIYSLVRCTAFVVSTWAGANFANTEEVVRNWSWTGLVGQAGVSMGMLVLISKKMPHFSSELTAILMGSVIIQQIVGPPLFSIALRRHAQSQLPGGLSGK